MKRKLLSRVGSLLLVLALAVSLVMPAAAVDLADVSLDLIFDNSSIKDGTINLTAGGASASVEAEVSGAPENASISYRWTADDHVELENDTGKTVRIIPESAGMANISVTVNVTADGETMAVTAGLKANVANAAAPKLEKIEIIPPSPLNLAAGGASAVFRAEGTMTDGGKYTGTSFAWDSSNKTVATVESNDTVKPLAEGETIITARAEGIEGRLVVTVAAAPASTAVNGITLNPTTVVLNKNDTRRITATITPDTATNKNISWSSSDTAVITLKDEDNGGVTIEAKSPGKAIITATTEDGEKTARCEVEVSGVTITHPGKSLIINGGPLQLEYGVFGAAKEGALSWESSAEHIVSVSQRGTVSGISVGKATITASVYRTGYSASCEINVEEDVADAIDRSLSAGEKLDFTGLRSELDSRCREKTKAGLDYITNLQVATKQGVLHYKYGSPDIPNHGVGGVDLYYYDSGSGDGRRAISDLSFVPAGDFSGTAVIEYTGYSKEGIAFHGTIRVDVKNSGSVMFSTAVGRPLTLSAKEFRDICQLKTGRSASYITFSQPSASKGTLYYNYVSASQWAQKVDGTTKYYLSSNPSVEKVTFVPAQNYTGTVSIPYRCTDTTGGSFSDTMTINVYANGGSAEGGVQYTTGINQRVTLNASDFDSACQEENGRRLNYILFDSLPAASEGILYYNYTSSSSQKVNTSTNYYRNSTSPRISSITFVPATNFSGVVSIPYIGYDTAGQIYKDHLVINVSDAAGTVYYTTGVDDPVTFRTEDFNDACLRANGASLNYITFIPPSSSLGTLYRNYRSGTNTGTRVSSSSTHFYRGGSPSVSDVTFVPRSRYEGTVSIVFGGQDVNGDVFEGKINISVGQGTGRVVSYSVASAGVVRFSASDFNAACRTATGEELNYVTFELPASRYGTLYYQYNASRGSGTLVSTSNSYYRSGGSSSRLLDDVYFVSANVNGVASFLYTARSTGGKQFTGTVEIAIGNAALDSGYSNGTYYIGSAAPIALRTVDFEQACQTAIGGALSYIRFTSLPNESVGRLYLNYESPSRPGGEATTTSNYTVSSGLTIGQLSFVPKAGYEGQVNIPYTGYTAQGSSFSGSVVINISVNYCATPFYDVDYGWDWAKPSVEFLRWAGISNGYSNGSFRPSRSISRGEFTLMVCRAFGFDTSARVSSFPDVPAGSPYAGAIAMAKSMGIVEGSGGRFRPDSPITRQSAMAIICRAMKAAGQKLPTTGSSTLNAYRDHAQIASHARESVAALVSLGVVRGSTDMRINPTRAISRAEMAVILHRVLTL